MRKEITLILALLIIIGSTLFLINSKSSITSSGIQVNDGSETYYDLKPQDKAAIEIGSAEYNCCSCGVVQ